MVRPSESDKRRELARSAVEVLQREGLELPVARLADLISVKRPLLLYYFPTYSHILETELVSLLSEQSIFVTERMARLRHPVDRLYAQLCAIHEFHHGREDRFVFLTQAIAATAGKRLHELLAVAEGVFEAHRQAHIAALHAGMADGSVAQCIPEAVMALVRAVTDGLMVQRVLSDPPVEAVLELVWTGILRPLRRDGTSQTVPITQNQEKPVEKRPRKGGALPRRVRT